MRTAVGGRFRAERAQEVVIGLAGGADDVRAAGTGELRGRGPNAAGGSVDEDRLVRHDAEQVVARTAVSAAAGSAAASAHESPAGLAA